MARARERDRLRPHLSEFACPVLLLLGGAPHDGGPRPGEVIELAESLPAFTVDTVPAVGAFVQEERPEAVVARSEEHTSELQSRLHLVCRLLLEKKKKQTSQTI